MLKFLKNLFLVKDVTIRLEESNLVGILTNWNSDELFKELFLDPNFKVSLLCTYTQHYSELLDYYHHKKELKLITISAYNYFKNIDYDLFNEYNLRLIDYMKKSTPSRYIEHDILECQELFSLFKK